MKDGQAEWRKHKVKVDGQTKIDHQRHGNCETLCHNVQHLHLYPFKGEGGQKKCMFCTLVKTMIIMDDPLAVTRSAR